MVKWDELTNSQKNELIAEKVFGWIKKEEGNWYQIDNEKTEKLLLTLPLFSTDPATIWLILDQFDSYQITKMFPENYRTIIQANKNVGYSLELNDSVCKAALMAVGIKVN
ncbi:hypothetical protein [Priestia megaterium]|uniref:hypothetical protein n=1 Tax=Priestia megaterium TaxID=1404 RepID=UPI0021D69B7F|nr:hypothetical protein [Priestia megaterium]MCU7738869.1 hypothetical protein [Priestia megaterium]